VSNKPPTTFLFLDETIEYGTPTVFKFKLFLKPTAVPRSFEPGIRANLSVVCVVPRAINISWYTVRPYQLSTAATRLYKHTGQADTEMAAAALEEKIERARQELRDGLRKQCSSNVSDEVVAAAEAFTWHGSLATQSEQSHKRVSELPDENTLALYIARAADAKILNGALMRATVHELDRKEGVDVGSIAQRVRRARSRGRNFTVPQIVVEATPPLQAAPWYLLFGMFCLVVYMVEQIQKSNSTKQ
jgi:hypothetical protein